MPENTIGTPQPSSLARRSRYARSPAEGSLVSLTPAKLDILRCLAELRFLSLPQIARLCCPSERQDLADKAARRHMRALFDSGLVDVLPVSRAALAAPGTPNDASLLYGSAPNVYATTTQALKLLVRTGLIDDEILKRHAPAYGPRNSLFLAHELAVRDARVWLELVARQGGYTLEDWHDGEEAAIRLQRTAPPFSVRPDAWFALRLSSAVLVGLVEVDRGTERGDRRWREKIAAYDALFASGLLPSVTGYVNARILVLTPDAARRDALAELIAKEIGTVGLAERFWLADMTALLDPCLGAPVWRRLDGNGLTALVNSG